MSITPPRKGRKAEALLAAALALSFFTPWLYSMGAPIKAHEIRDRLAGPHRLLSAFSRDNRISEDYRMSIFLYAVPLIAGLALVLIGMRRYRPWIGFLAGAIAVSAFLFLRGEITTIPFHRLAWGAYAALAAGIGLAIAPVVRIFTR